MSMRFPHHLALPLLLALAACGAGTSESAPDATDGSDFILTEQSIELPMGDMQFPEGPDSELVDANCIACHSPGMALTQPKLSAEQWRATVVKMRDVYKAPIEDGDIDSIVGYFVAWQRQAG